MGQRLPRGKSSSSHSAVVQIIYRYAEIVALCLAFFIILGLASCRRDSSVEPASTVSKPILKVIPEDADVYAGPVVRDYSPLQKKLREIVIDHIEFEEVTIPTVIKYLKQRSRMLDAEKKGVNLVLVMGRTVAAAENVTDDIDDNDDEDGWGDDDDDDDAWGDDDDDDDGVTGPIEIPTVTMVVDDIPLGEAIRYICRAANLKYRIEEHAVVIASQNVPFEDIETKLFPFPSKDAERIHADDPEALREYFARRGISFPDGASMVYDPQFARVIANNTSDNLARITECMESGLQSYGTNVVVESRYVRIPEKDFAELRGSVKDEASRLPFWQRIITSANSQVVSSASVVVSPQADAEIHLAADREEPSPDNKKQTGEKGANDLRFRVKLNTAAGGSPLGIDLRTNDQWSVRPILNQLNDSGLLKTWGHEAKLYVDDGETVMLSARTLSSAYRRAPDKYKHLMLLTTHVIAPNGQPGRYHPGVSRLGLKSNKPKVKKEVIASKRKAAKLVIGSLNIEDAVVKNVLEQLETESRKADSAGSGIKIECRIANAYLSGIRRVNLSFRNMPLADIFRYVRMQTGLNYWYTAEGVIFSNSSGGELENIWLPIQQRQIADILSQYTDQGFRPASGRLADHGLDDYFKQRGIAVPMGVRSHREEGKRIIDSSEMESSLRLRESLNLGRRRFSGANAEMLMHFLSQRGIDFYEGSFLAYDLEKSQLLVKNTAKNNKQLEMLLRDLDTSMLRVEVDVKAIEISDEAQAKLVEGDKTGLLLKDSTVIDPVVLQGLLHCNQARILLDRQVTVQSGQAVSVKLSENERPMPEAINKDDASPTLPCLKLTATVLDDLYTVDLGVDLNLTWKSSNPRAVLPERSAALKTRLEAPNGQTVFLGRISRLEWENAFRNGLELDSNWEDIIGKAVHDKCATSNVYVFVKARLIGTNGAYVPGADER